MSSNDDPSPLMIALLCVIAVVVVTVLAWYFHFLGWGLHADSVNREGHVNRQSYGYQQAARERLSGYIATINDENVQIAGTADPTQKNAIGAQRWNTVNQACATGAEITEPSPDQASWLAENCQASAGKPASQYAPAT